jgi:D-aspartate ligase
VKSATTAEFHAENGAGQRTRPAPDRAAADASDTPRSAQAGAIVLGGDYQGLGIVRSLGRRGSETCVIDDERSISRFSRYATVAVRVDTLRDERRAIDNILDVGVRFGLDGWVLYPTREETVVALSRHRAMLAERFRVATPPLDVVRWAWDKRKTYAKAASLGIPTPRTWQPAEVADLDAIDGTPPWARKPALKEPIK